MSDTRLARPQVSEDEARRLDAAARRRLSAAAADLALPEALRLGDWQRVTVRSLFAKLVRAIEDELRSALLDTEVVRGHEPLAAAFGSGHLAVAGPMLEASGGYGDDELVAALIRRAEEHRRWRARAGEGEMPLLIELIRNDDPEIAAAAMAFLVGQNRRLDSFGDPDTARTELPADLQHRLVWRVAAALRTYMTDLHGRDPVAADEAVVTAAGRFLAAYDEGDTLEARALRLVRRLDAVGRLNDRFIADSAGQGSQPLLIAALALRLGLSVAAIWNVLSDPKRRGPIFLLRAARLGRPEAAAILVALGASEDVLGAQADLFDVTDEETAAEALRLWRFDAGYRAAIAELAV